MGRGILLLITFLLVIPQWTEAQAPLEEDNSVLFLKANILYESSRYDEAVRMYNRILKDDPDFSRAYFMRGKAKYALGAFRGTKQDLLEYIDLGGINAEIIELMGETEMKLDRPLSALSYFKLMQKLSPYEGKYFAKAGDIHYDNGDKNGACESWIKGAKLGDQNAAKLASAKCAYDVTIHLPSKTSSEDKSEDIPEFTMKEDSESGPAIDDQGEMEEVETETMEMDEPEMESLPQVDMNAIQEIEIDDELTIVITSGLGERKVENYPNILMLSDRSGRVVIKVCVDSEGKVESAELDDQKTTIFRSSLSSIAIRKAREFVFMPSFNGAQCGAIIFNINTEG